MPSFELMILLTLDHPWEINRQRRMRADGPGMFSRLRSWLRPSLPAQEPTGLAARAASRYRLTAAAHDDSRPRRLSHRQPCDRRGQPS